MSGVQSQTTREPRESLKNSPKKESPQTDIGNYSKKEQDIE